MFIMSVSFMLLGFACCGLAARCLRTPVPPASEPSP